MDVLLHIVSAAPPVPVSEVGLRSSGSDMDGSCVCLAVGELRLTRPAAPAPSPRSDDERGEGLRGARRADPADAPHDWLVSLGTTSSALDRRADDAVSDAARVQESGEAAVHQAGPAPVCVRASALDLVDPRGRPHARSGDRVRAGIADLVSLKLRRLWRLARTACGDGHGAPQRPSAPHGVAESVLVYGSRHSTRKDALYITLLHRLLTECAAHARAPGTGSTSTAVHAEVSLVDYDAVWGAGDVLADSAMPGSTTWLPVETALDLATLPAADAAAAVSVRARHTLQAWFDRIDNAAARFPDAAHAMAAAASVSVGERRRHLASNAVFFTLRLRCGSSATHAAARAVCVPVWHLTLVLLPDSTVTACSAGDGADTAEDAADVLAHRASVAVLWRELEALAAYTRAQPAHPSEHRRHARHAARAALTVQEGWRAAALRRSRWLACLARLHAPPHIAAAAARETAPDTLAAFLAASSARSFTWVGCIDAAAEHGRATRSTLAYLARLQSTTRRHRRLHAREPPHEVQCSAVRSPPPSPRGAGEAPQPHAPPPQRIGLSSLDTSADADGSGAGHSAATDDAAVGEPQPAVTASPPTTHTAADALVASLQGYIAVLEDEVRRLRARLDKFEPTAPTHDTHAAARSASAPTLPPPSQQVAVPAPLTTAAPALPASVAAAVDELRNDPQIPTALRVQLDHFAAQLAEATSSSAVVGMRAVSNPLAATHASRARDTSYVALLEARVALYEQKLALMDHYVAPALVRCVSDLDHLYTPQPHPPPHRQRLPEERHLAVGDGRTACAPTHASRQDDNAR